MTDNLDNIPPPASSDGAADQNELDILMCARRAAISTFSIMCRVDLSERPRIEHKDIIFWMNRMRILKPHFCSIISVIGFHHSQVKLKRFEVHGIMVLYLPESTAELLILSMGIPLKDIDEFTMMDGCGEFLNVIAGAFKTELYKEGYEELEMSVPRNFITNVDELFELNQTKKFEITFRHEGAPFFQLDLALDKIVKR